MVREGGMDEGREERTDGRGWREGLGVCKYHTSNDVFFAVQKCAQNGYREK